jgi:glycosyltransferase involved in cell wall biosynthesis
MKNLLYIGNKLTSKGKTATTIDTLSENFAKEDYSVKAVSNKQNKLLRMLDMLLSIIKYRHWADFVLIDTYSTQNFYYAFLCSQLCRCLKLKYIPVLHGGNLPNRLKNNPKLSQLLFKKAFVNISPSEYLKSNFESYGYNNITIIPNAIALEDYDFYQRPIDDVKLLWVRSFSNIYNPNLAIDVLKALKKKGVRSSLTMVGPDNDGSLGEAKTYAKSLNLDVIFTGKLTKKEWVEQSKVHNVFINTTNFDNMPVSVIEAMALGLPVISTNVGGLPFLINNEIDGFLIPPKNANAFVSKIEEIMSRPEKVNSITTAARKKVELYGWQKVKEKWYATLK